MVNSLNIFFSIVLVLPHPHVLTLLLLNTGVLDDAYALCMAGKQKLVSLLHLIAAFKDETEYTVLAHVITVCSFYLKSPFSYTWIFFSKQFKLFGSIDKSEHCRDDCCCCSRGVG